MVTATSTDTRTTPRRRPIAAALIPLAVAVVALTACGGDDNASSKTSTTALVTTTPSTGAGGSTTTGAATTTTPGASATAPSTTGTNGALDLADGRHPVFITAIDVPARTVTFDVVQFLTGSAAVEAYHQDYPSDPEGPPNDYYIVNDNTKLRTANVSDSVTVQLVRLADDSDPDLDPGTFDELPAYFTALPTGTVWLTVTGGVITGIEEQYLP